MQIQLNFIYLFFILYVKILVSSSLKQLTRKK